jgi:hypothetical protein
MYLQLSQYIVLYCHLLYNIVISIVFKIVQKNLSHLKTMVEDGLVSSANISAVLLGMDGAMDDIPLFCPASMQAWLAYHCSKKLMLVSLISD